MTPQDKLKKNLAHRLREARKSGESPEAGFLLVSLEEFFRGNTDDGSIGCNLVEHPGVAVFHVVLSALRERKDVSDVLLEITDLNEHQADAWPFSDYAWVFTTTSLDEIEVAVERLQPDSVTASDPPHGVKLAAGERAFVIWWD